MGRHPVGRERFHLRHQPAWSSSRTIWLISFPSALPLYFGSTWPMTLPMSLAPPAIACRTAARISSGSAAGGRNSSSTLIWDASVRGQIGPARGILLDRLPPDLDALPQHVDDLVVRGRTPKIDLAVLEIGEDGAEDQGAFLVLRLAGRVEGGAQVAVRLDSGDTRTTPAFADGGARLALPFFARLFEVSVLAEVRQDAGLLALLLESFERPLEALVIVDDDFWHSLTHPSRPGKGRCRNKFGIYSGEHEEQERAERADEADVADA